MLEQYMSSLTDVQMGELITLKIAMSCILHACQSSKRLEPVQELSAKAKPL